MTETTDHAVISTKGRYGGSSRRDGRSRNMQHSVSQISERELQNALSTILRAFPAFFHDVCDDCQRVLENRLNNLAEGGTSHFSSHEANSSSFSPSYGERSYDVTDTGMGASTSSGSAHYPLHRSEKREHFTRSEEEAASHGSASNGESFKLSVYANGKRSGKDNELNFSENTRKQLHYHENGEEQNGEPYYNMMPARWSRRGRNNYDPQNTQEMVTPYKIASNPPSNSEDFATRSFDEASPIEFDEEKGSVKQDNTDVEQKEWTRFQKVVCKKDFMCPERINGRLINVTEGLELHAGVLNAREQARVVALALDLQKQGRNNELLDRTYSEPRKWMPGKGRVTIQFGCCYNYAMDKYGNPPGIIHHETVDPMPNLIKAIIRRLVRWHILPPSCVPDSCIINIYDEGDCIPPHIDHHDFVRPFCTLSLLSECKIVFGSNLKIVGPGEFQGSIAISLPVGSVLVLKGNGADVAKHAVPAVPTKRISITFRRMYRHKVPYGYSVEKDLQGITPL